MSRIKTIRSEADYTATLARVDALMSAEPGTPEGDELDILTDLVEHYESKHVPMGYPSAKAAIEFRMEQAGLTPRDLVPFIGSRAKVSEVLSGKRKLTMPMARALHQHLGIPADVLLQEPGATLAEPLGEIEWERFPLNEMAKLGWIPDVPDLTFRAEEFIRDLICRAGGPDVAVAPLYRKTNHPRTNAKTDPYALKAWCWRVLATANETRPPIAYEPGSITLDLMRQLAHLSWSEDGPRLAKEFLAKHGLPLIVVPHLERQSSVLRFVTIAWTISGSACFTNSRTWGATWRATAIPLSLMTSHCATSRVSAKIQRKPKRTSGLRRR